MGSSRNFRRRKKLGTLAGWIVEEYSFADKLRRPAIPQWTVFLSSSKRRTIRPTQGVGVGGRTKQPVGDSCSCSKGRPRDSEEGKKTRPARGVSSHSRRQAPLQKLAATHSDRKRGHHRRDFGFCPARFKFPHSNIFRKAISWGRRGAPGQQSGPGKIKKINGLVSHTSGGGPVNTGASRPSKRHIRFPQIRFCESYSQSVGDEWPPAHGETRQPCVISPHGRTNPFAFGIRIVKPLPLLVGTQSHGTTI